MSSNNTSGDIDSSSSPPILQNEVKYDLYRGHPNDQALPTSEIQSIMSSLLHDDHRESLMCSLGYGSNAGNEGLLLALRSFLDRRTSNDDTGEVVNEKDGSEFFITNGVSHGIELLCSTCTRPGDEVWIERPTYFLAPKIFTSHGLVIKPLPMISDRPSVEGQEKKDAIGRIDLERLIRMVECEGVPPPKMIYVIPSYHNPTGRSMTVEERTKLATFAIRNNVLLVADEVYHLLDWDQNQLKIEREALSGFRDSDATSSSSLRPASMTHFNNIRSASDFMGQPTLGCCISVSSFTKIFAPGVRLGWIQAPPYIIQRLTNYGYINSQGGVAPFMGRLMTQAIETGLLDQYLNKLNLDYSERYGLICNILEKEPRIEILTKHSPVKRKGGYFLWVQFPDEVDSEEFASYSLKEYGVRFMPGGRSDPFPLHDNPSRLLINSCARLCFADLDREKLVVATTTFVKAFQTFLQLKA
ncbi:hypothetical protein HJC23_007440 [Cyclotella cryptica]|uniref:Aminotransferase class I/classII large domain-containing protein n=1 Tax=Cyclotella cryptica TaxID=29204 RepID=A0ABD3QIN5_9STRA|eukprot:CCRYP_005200-RA/>CCRYP_005200-RA protein AED:0.00 eAED:0.00 QI:56/-1/1/1/-1/1/1/82/470